MSKLKAAPPHGANVAFRKLSGNKFEIALPEGMTCSRAAAAIFASRNVMALDGAIHGGFPGERRETAWNKVCRLAREAGLDGEAMSAFERALTELAEHRDAGSLGKPDDDETDEGEAEAALDQESDLPSWAADPKQRSLHWNAVADLVRKRGASDSDVEELKGKWQERYGKLPLRNALEGGYGGETRKLARDRARRRQAMDRWGPDAARLDGTPLENRYGEQPEPKRTEASAATYERWPEAARIIG